MSRHGQNAKVERLLADVGSGQADATRLADAVAGGETR